MQNLQADELTIQVDASSPQKLSLIWLGRSNSRNPGAVLHPWFTQLFSEAAEQHRRVEMSFEKLEHFNSSTIAVLIQVINEARDRKVPLTLRYDAGLKWQTLSFDALRRALRAFESANQDAPVQFVPGGS